MSLDVEEIDRSVTFFVQIKTHAPAARWETYGFAFLEYPAAVKKQAEIADRYAQTRIRRRTQLDEILTPTPCHYPPLP